MTSKIILLFGIFFCGLSVVLGAFGAHALKDKISSYYLEIYEKAIFYQFIHGMGILLISSLKYNDIDFTFSLWCFIIGIFLFSGSLYILSLTGIKWLGAITPFGGTLFVIGWFSIFYKVLYN